MKQVINITLGGIVFTCESEAYDALSVYLEGIKTRYRDNEDYAEISGDIESAMAEKFLARGRNEKKAISTADVEQVTKELGSVSEFEDEADTTEDTSKTTSDTEKSEQKEGSTKKRRLYRNMDDALLGGVASGIAAYIDVDPVIVRVVFFVSLFLGGFGVISYLLLWVIVPAAKTTEERYAMRGEQVTLSGITDNVKKKIENIDIDTEQLKKNAKNTWGGLRPLFVKFFEIIGVIVRYFFIFLRFVIGIAFIVSGALAIAAIVASTIAVITGSGAITFDPTTQAFITQVFTATFDGVIFLLGAAFVMIVPMLFLLIAGGSLVKGVNQFSLGNSITLFVVWFIAVACTALMGVRYAPEFLPDTIRIDIDRRGACTLEAKVCPDGSSVGRSGPQCEFTAFPDEAPVKDMNQISVTFPIAGDTVTSPMTVTGEAQGTWFFEGDFPIVVVNWDGLIIGEGYASAVGEWMTEEYVPFSGSVEIDLENIGEYHNGTVIFQRDNPSGLPEHDASVEVQVQF